MNQPKMLVLRLLRLQLMPLPLPLPLLLLLLLLLLVAPGVSLADGMFLTSAPYFIQEPAQQALIRFSAENQEELTIMPGFYGDTRNFAWIIPVPSLPVVEEGNARIFAELQAMTRPRHHRRDGDWDGCQRQEDPLFLPAGTGVEVLENNLVGYFQTMTLASDQADALLDSLTQWGFLHEDNIEDATRLINDYVDDGWFFVTARIDSTTFQEANHQSGNYFFGSLQPLKLSFESEDWIYPMRISAASTAESNQLIVYTIAEHRKDFPQAQTQYANRFSQHELDQISDRPVASELLTPGSYLTRLSRFFIPTDMDEDILLVQAPSDQEYLEIYFSGVPWMTLLLLGTPLLWGLLRRLTGTRKAIG